jgi:hypothetical protein
MIWASLLAAILKRSIAHFAETSLGVELSAQRAAATGKHYFDDGSAASGSRRVNSAVPSLKRSTS